MSDPGDKSRRDVTPLPRTNRPRPETARRRLDSTSTQGGRDGAPATARAPITTPGDDVELHSAPDSALNVPVASRSAVFGISEDGPALAERPTQLDQPAPQPQDRDTAPSNLSADLRKVTLTRADGNAVKAEDVASAAAYIGCVIDGRYRMEGVLGRGGM